MDVPLSEKKKELKDLKKTTYNIVNNIKILTWIIKPPNIHTFQLGKKPL